MSARGLHPQGGVEIGQRLVHQEDLRLPDDGPGQGHPLALAARELGRLAVQQGVEPERGRGLLHLGRALVFGHAPLAQRELDVPGHAQVGVQGVALKDHGHVSILRVDVVDHAVPRWRSVPSVTSSSPATRRSAVVLPQPDEPSSTRSSPSGMVEGQGVDGHGVAEPLGHPLEAHLCQRAPPARCRSPLVRRQLPPHRLGDLLAGRAQPVALGIAARHPLLPAEGPDGGAVDDALDDARPGGDEVALSGGVALQDDVGHPVVVAFVELLVGAGRSQRRPALVLGRQGSPGGVRSSAVCGRAHRLSVCRIVLR